MAEWQKNKYDKNIRIETNGRARLVDDTNDAEITVNPIYVGTVTNGSGFPSQRPSGDALSDGDYVKVNPSSTLPFTLYSGGNAITFYTVGDQAIWDEANSCWKYDPSSPRSTAGVTLADASTESTDPTDYVQQDANKHFTYWINWLLEEIKKAGYSFDFTSTDTDSVRSLHYVLYDKTGAVISSKDFNDFLLKTRQIAGIDLADNITVTELEGALKEEPVVYKNKSIDADNNPISNLEVDNFKDTAITTSGEMSTSTNWTDDQIPTTKAVRSVTGSDFELNYYSSGYTGTNNPYLEFKMKNGEGTVIADHSIEIDNPIDTIVYNEKGTATDNTLTITFDNGTTSDMALTNVVITDHTQTLTNKTIDADNNTISNLEVDNFKVNTSGSATAGVIVTEIVSSEDDTMLPTAKAVYDYATYGIDSETVIEPDVSNKVTIKLQDKDGNNRDTTDIMIPSDIEEVSSLPASGQRSDRLYFVTGTKALYWWFNSNWYDLADTNGVIQVTTLEDPTTAQQDAMYHEINSNTLNWSNGTKWINISNGGDNNPYVASTFDASTATLKLVYKDSSATSHVIVPMADRGLDIVSNKVGHVNAITADTTNTANPVALQYDEYGHVTAVTKLWTVTNAFTPVGSTNTFQLNLNAYENGGTAYYKKNMLFTNGLVLARTDDGGTGSESNPYVQTTTIGHSNSITAQTTEGLQSITYDAYGHITSGTAKTLDRGISDSSNVIGHSNSVTKETSNTVHPVALKYDAYGHVTGATKLNTVYGMALSTSGLTLSYVNTSDKYYKYTVGPGNGMSATVGSSSGEGSSSKPYTQAVTLGHSNTAITAVTSFSTNLYQFKFDAYGHITGYQKTVVGNGLSLVEATSGSTTTYTLGHSNTAITAQTTQAAYKVKIDAYGHITAASKLTSETWKFTLSDGTTTSKTVWVG